MNNWSLRKGKKGSEVDAITGKPVGEWFYAHKGRGGMEHFWLDKERNNLEDIVKTLINKEEYESNNLKIYNYGPKYDTDYHNPGGGDECSICGEMIKTNPDPVVGTFLPLTTYIVTLHNGNLYHHKCLELGDLLETIKVNR